MEQEFGCDSDGNESLDLFEEEEGDDDLDFSEASGGQGGPRLEATAGLQDTDGNDKTWTENKSIKSTSVSNSTSSCNKPTNPIPNATDDATSTPSPSPPISRIGLNAHKAGMEGLDKTKINQIILEASRGSKFYENEVRKERQATERISRMTAALKGLTSTQKLSALRAADRETERLEAGRDLSRIVVHVDMDAFYAAVETRDEPWLRDVPMAVGGNSMLSTSNYLARRYGVRAAMPGFIGKKLCPRLVIVKPNFTKYKQVSSEVRQILAEYDPDFCPVGLDESFLDLTDYVRASFSAVPEEDCCTAGGGVADAGECCVESPSEGDEPATFPGARLKLEQRAVDSYNKDAELFEHKRCLSTNVTRTSNDTLSSVAELPSAGRDASLLTAESDPPVGTETCKQSSSDCHGDQHGNETAYEPRHGNETVYKPRHGSGCKPPLSSTTPDHPEFNNPLQSEDEATPTLPWSHWERAQTVVQEIRARIQEKTTLTASAGIAPNKMLAKVASDMNKPNGQFFVTPTRENVLQFVQSLPIRKISGIGKVTERLLNALGVTSCRELYQHRAVLQLLFSQTSAHYFLRVCLGIGSADVHRDYERKSMSTERTFSELSDPADLQRKCQELCQALAEDLEREGLKGRTVTLKLKTVFFEVKSRAVTLSRAVSSAEEIHRPASELLRAELKACSPAPLRLRLMGVRLSSLSGSDRDRGASKTLERFLQQPDGGGGGKGGARNSRAGSGGLTEVGELGDEVDSSEFSDQGLMAACPVCGHRVPADNATFNRHIDECLNHSTIREVITADPAPAPSANKAYSSPLKTEKHSDSLRRSPAKPASQSRKRKPGGGPEEGSPAKRRTLDQFWKR